jgi:putative DNA methylase
MSVLAKKIVFEESEAACALEDDFPNVEVSEIAEQESWRKEINRPLYHIHKWWATRLGSVFRAITLSALSEPNAPIWDSFYKHHNFKGKVVLDPFMGSGTTIGEAVKLGAKAVGCDINPVSTFLVRQAFARVAEEDLRNAFEKLQCEVAPEIRRYYQTRDPLSGELIPVLYFFWVKILDTPTGEAIPLFSSYVFAQDAYANKKPQAQIVCPACWNILTSRYDAIDATCPHCKHGFNPQNGPANGQHITASDGTRHRIKSLLPADGTPPRHRLYAILALRPDGEKVYLPARPEDVALYDEAQLRLQNENFTLPTLAVRPGHNTDQARGYNYLHWRDFFNARQLLCLGILLRAILRIEDEAIQEQLLCLFSSTLEFNNMFCSFKGEGTGAVRHMFSNHILKPERTPLENSIWGTSKSSGTFLTLFESRLMRAKRYLDDPFEVAFENNLFGAKKTSQKITASNPINTTRVASWDEFESNDRAMLILNGDSAALPIPDCSIDAVVTDPPYFDFVHYSELSDFFYAWLAPVLKDRYPWFDRDNCSHAGEVQHNDPRAFARQLSYVFSECRRVLKNDGVLAFSFHHSRPEGWAAIYEAIIEAGLSIVAAHPVHAELRSSSPKSAAKDPISLDAILVCRKRHLAATSFYAEEAIIKKAVSLAHKLQSAGLSISAADYFVISASQALISASPEALSFEQMEERLERLQLALKVTGNGQTIATLSYPPRASQDVHPAHLHESKPGMKPGRAIKKH